MWTKTRLPIILTLIHFLKSSEEACKTPKRHFAGDIFKRELRWYVECVDINSDFHLRSEIISETKDSFLYNLSFWRSSIPAINQGTFQNLTIYDLNLDSVNIQIIQDRAFESCKISNIGLENNQIKEIKERSFNSSAISEIKLQNNSLSEITAYNFVGLIGLTKLDLHNNQLTTIQPGSFNDLGLLNYLDLSFNKLKYIPKGLFMTLKNVNKIYLNYNFLNSLNIEIFSLCSNLLDLRLQNNYLQVINTVLYPRSLQIVKASGNYLTAFNLSSMTNVHTLDLSHNRITTVNLCPEDPVSLQYVFLDYNQLSMATLRGSLQCLKNVSEIYMAGNILEQVDIRIFQNLEHLLDLSLSDNNLTNLDLSNFESDLTILNVSSNSLSEVKNLSRLQKLEKLDLSINSLQEIKYNMFANMSNLKKVYLHHNLISSLELGCFRHLTMLKELDLSYNKITSVLLGVFTGLGALNILDISHNNLANFDMDIFHNIKGLNSLNIAYNYLKNANIKQMMSHLYWSTPIRIDLNGNQWSCMALVNISRDSRFLIFVHGTSFNVSNVYGVACDNSEDLDNGIHYDESQYSIQMIQFMNFTTSYTKEISLKVTLSNYVFIIMLILLIAFCGNLVYTKYSSYTAATKQFVYKKSTNEEEIHLM